MHWSPICEIKSRLALAMAFLTLCVNAHEWNFTKGVPTGGTLRKGALMTMDGLVAANVTNGLAAAGFELQGELSGIEAFSFEADLILGGLTDSQKGASRASYTSTVFDGTGGKPGLKCGLLVELASFRGSWSPRIHLGYGDEIVTLIGPMSILHAGARVRLRVVSDASRSVTIEFAGKRKDMLFSRTGPIADAGKRPPVIGDSIGRWHRPFDGTIRRVEIRTFPRSPFDVRFGARAAFMRGEPDAELKIIAENVSGGEMRDVRATLSLLKEGNVIDRREYIIGAMPSNGRTELALPFETRFSPGWRQLDVALRGVDSNGRPVRCEKRLQAGIGPRSAPRMSAVMGSIPSLPLRWTRTLLPSFTLPYS